MLRILIAPTAFKGSLSPTAVAKAIENGIGRACGWSSEIETVLLPLADGGDGTIEAVRLAAGGTVHEEQVLGATGNPVSGAQWLQLGDQAFVELASACGIASLHGHLDAMNAHTYGLGQIMCRCYEFGMRTINVAVGGSASTDGGMGALRALGVCFFDDQGNEFEALGGRSLNRIADCDLTEVRWFTKETRVRVLTDVENPLLGANGAARVYGPQKGATSEQVEELDSALAKFADIVEQRTGKQLRDTAGAGAAGGTAFGLAACLDAEIVSGFEWIARVCELDRKLQSSDLVITGEGCFDNQSLSGKVLGQLLRRCQDLGKPLWVVAGAVEDGCRRNDIEQVIVPNAASGAFCTDDEITESVEAAFKRKLVESL